MTRLTQKDFGLFGNRNSDGCIEVKLSIRGEMLGKDGVALIFGRGSTYGSRYVNPKEHCGFDSLYVPRKTKCHLSLEEKAELL